MLQSTKEQQLTALFRQQSKVAAHLPWLVWCLQGCKALSRPPSLLWLVRMLFRIMGCPAALSFGE